jgi:hypothetical protein
MFKLYNLYEEVILEAVQRDSIIDAITKHQRVNIIYNDDKETVSQNGSSGTGKRTIEVYLYGKLRGGGQAIRAYQIFGDTKTHKPMWKTFLVDNIVSWEPLNSFFYTPISDRDPVLKNRGMSYRDDGHDKLFDYVHVAADFNDKYQKNNNTGVFSNTSDDEPDQKDVGKVQWNEKEPKRGGLNTW